MNEFIFLKIKIYIYSIRMSWAYEIYKLEIGTPISFNAIPDNYQRAWIKVEEEIENKILKNLIDKLGNRESWQECLKNNNDNIEDALIEYFNRIGEPKFIDNTLLMIEKRKQLYDEMKEKVEIDVYTNICVQTNEELFSDICLYEIDPKKRISIFNDMLFKAIDENLKEKEETEEMNREETKTFETQ